MDPHPPRRAAVLAVAAVGLGLLYGAWRDASNRGGQQPADPFRIAGSLYYVGANDVTSFLLTGPEGHVLIDGGYPGTAPMILESIAALGVDVADVEVILNTHPHLDHAGGIAELQAASGAAVWAPEAEADVLASGGASDTYLGPFSVLTRLPIFRYPAPRVDHQFASGDTVRVGPVEVVAVGTPGHTPGCTSWAFTVADGDRDLDVVLVCGLAPPVALVFDGADALLADFERTFATLRGLRPDIFLTPHARDFGRWPKYQASLGALDPVAPFIDPEGYRAHLDAAEARLRAEIEDTPASDAP